MSISQEEIAIQWASEQLGINLEATKVRSGAHNSVYKLSAVDKGWFLKVGGGLQHEYERILWLQDKLPVPKVIAFKHEGEADQILMTEIEGIDLAHLSKHWPPDKIISNLAQALQEFHSINAKGCPFKSYKPGSVLVHGDACLPNFIFKKDETFSGYVDLLDMGVGDIEVDLSAAIWSLQYNLGPGHGLTFLRQYGVENADESSVERLRLMYENSPIFER